MTSLSETYGARGSRARKRLLAGTGLFLTGALMIVAGIVVGSTDVLAAYGIDAFGAREIAGILGGLGVPAVFVGVFIVLPASRGKRAAAAIGAATAVLGVVLFSFAYPEQWARAYGSPDTNLTLPVATVYVAGVLTTFWVLFTAIVNVKANSPGGKVTLQRIIQQAAGTGNPGSHRPGSKPSAPSGGSVGVAGSLDSGASAFSGTASDDDSALPGTDAGQTDESPLSETGTASDGGTDAERLRMPDSGQSGPDGTVGSNGGTADPPGVAGTTGGTATDPDRYCGNCGYFEYVRADGGMQPYCGFHDELMDDMEACEEWQANTPGGDTPGRSQ
jgi:hypothetical protein